MCAGVGALVFFNLLIIYAVLVEILSSTITKCFIAGCLLFPALLFNGEALSLTRA